MEMYIKIGKKVENGTDILYKENEINYFYIYLTLKTLFLDLKRKESKVNTLPIDTMRDFISQNECRDYDQVYADVQNELNNMYWYDKKVWQILESGESIAELSRKSGIPYYSLYNTFKKVKQKLKKLL
jgi:hypothetical protein